MSSARWRRAGAAAVPALARLPALALEQAIVEALRTRHRDRFEGDATALIDPALTRDETDAALLARSLDRVVVRQGVLELQLRDDPDADAPAGRLTIPWTKPVATRRRQIILPEESSPKLQPIRVDEQARLVRAIAAARRWAEELIAGDVADFAALAVREGRTERSIRMGLSLAFLDPRLIERPAPGACRAATASRASSTCRPASTINGRRSA
jgi:hypothetical protein